MAKTKINYNPGSVFLVPVRDSGFAIGVVVALDGSGIVFGYFFGPRLEAGPAEVPDPAPEHRILWGQFGDLGLINGEWKVLGELPCWQSDDWPMPGFVRVDDETGAARKSVYDPHTFVLLSEEPCDPSLVESLPYDGLMGYGFVEIRLTKLLA